MTSKKPERNPRAKIVRPAAAAIQDALKLRGISDAIRANRLNTEWIELVGDRIAKRTRPVGVFERVLHVEVATSVWMQELNLLRAQLLSGLLERFGEPRLFDELRFKLAGRTRRDEIVVPPGRKAPSPVARPFVFPATGEHREAIIDDVSRVDDEELRELIARVRITHAR